MIWWIFEDVLSNVSMFVHHYWKYFCWNNFVCFAESKKVFNRFLRHILCVECDFCCELKWCFVVCQPLENIMARKRCFLAFPRLGNMTKKRCSSTTFLLCLALGNMAKTLFICRKPTMRRNVCVIWSRPVVNTCHNYRKAHILILYCQPLKSKLFSQHCLGALKRLRNEFPTMIAFKVIWKHGKGLALVVK